jgi:heat shock protein HslJ
VWQWQETRSNTGEVTLRPDDPTHYTVEFLPDGTLAIQADCNRAMGTYTVTGSQLDVQIGGVTRMACPPGSLMDPFLADLARVVSYFIQQTLTLALAGGGVMPFTAVVPTPATATPEAG